MVSKRRTKRRYRQLKGGEETSSFFGPLKNAFVQTGEEFKKKAVQESKKFKKKASKQINELANKAQESLADGEKDADEEKSKWCINNGFEKSTQNADREVKAAVIHARKEVDKLEHDVERSHASSPHTPATQYGGRKRRKTKRRKTKRRKTKKNTKRRKKRKSRRRRRK